MNSEADPGAGHSREDLIQVEHELYSLMLRDARRKALDDPLYVSADFLGAEPTDLAVISASVTPPDIEAVQLELGRRIEALEPELITAPRIDEPATWTSVEVRGERVRVPDYVGVRAPAGTLTDVPMTFRAWPRPKQYPRDYFIHAYARAEHREIVEGYFADLVQVATVDRSPYRHQVIEANMDGGSLQFRFVSFDDLDRSSLVLADDVWDAIGRNVDRMFERMDRLEAAGLGSNRGLVLSGPPGTGKSALCKALAREYEGRATVTILSAAVGHYLLRQVYERLNDLAPALVLVEDLDLLVGDREEHERSPLVEFLTVLDGLMTHHSRVVTVATTNDAKMIDEAAVRAARFDQVVQLELPNADQREQILELYLRSLDHQGDVERLASASDGLSGADLREVVRSAVLDADGEVLGHEDLQRALDRRSRAVARLQVGFAA